MVALLHFRHPDFADDSLIVSTGLALSDWMRASLKPVDARFTHTLEPARPVTGVVTDEEDRPTACRRARRDASDA